MEGKYVSNEEKEFFERMKFKIENEPAPANDLIMSNRNNNDGIYIVRCYDYAFRIGCHVGEEYKKEFYDKYILTSIPTEGLSGLEYETADEAFESVFKGAGARLPKLDAVDTRLLKEAHGDIDPKYIGVAKARFKDGGTESPRGTGIINSPNDISTEEYDGKYITFEFSYKLPYGTKETVNATNIYPDLSGTSAVEDTDGDGMPDVYEDNNSFNKDDASDGAAIAANGYSNLENFLNAVVAGEVTPEGQPTAVEVVQSSEPTINSSVEKIIDGNRLLIKKGNKAYNTIGQITK